MDEAFIDKIQRWFYALDTEKVGSLSLSDLRRGMSYSMGWSRMPSSVLSELFNKAVDRGQNGDGRRLDFLGFLGVVVEVSSGQKRV